MQDVSMRMFWIQPGTVYVHLRGYRTVALPNAVDAEPLKNLQADTALQAFVA
jgi:hypothetical protein